MDLHEVAEAYHRYRRSHFCLLACVALDVILIPILCSANTLGKICIGLAMVIATVSAAISLVKNWKNFSRFYKLRD